MTVAELKIILAEVPEDYEVAMVDSFGDGGASRVVDADPQGTVDVQGTPRFAVVLS